MAEKVPNADAMFSRGWEEINARIEKLRADLDLAERKGLGEATKKAIGKQLHGLEELIREYEQRWLAFEKQLKTLQERLGNRSP
ncbi:hypothetical protein JW921_11390 [Candidatus Fermentibacterales bacterium]|nr:hypothetical protein [Candidatus Fermentibacterales bacterium]